jgi:hypothetical protein
MKRQITIKIESDIVAPVGALEITCLETRNIPVSSETYPSANFVTHMVASLLQTYEPWWSESKSVAASYRHEQVRSDPSAGKGHCKIL